jgi:hypothetical protein
MTGPTERSTGRTDKVPGNFLGFYIFGWMMKRKFTWENFINTSQVTLVVSNVVVAFLYVYYRAFVEVSFPVAFAEAWVYVALGHRTCLIVFFGARVR